MNEKTKVSFEATITALLNASPKSSSKGNSMKEWFSNVFKENVRVARITEDKQLGNRINEQFIYRDSVVVFAIEPSVNKELLVEKIKERRYKELSTVLVVIANNHEGDYTYYSLLYKKETDFVQWVRDDLAVVCTGSLDELNCAFNLSVFSRLDLLAAIRTKPFILLAGMSGTGKTRIVRQLARGCCTKDHVLAANPAKPGNYECIPVRPNWHDSTGLMGYVSRVTGSPKYVVTDFVRFLAKAWLYENEGVPFFLCLDEMNLAPVEQYFAEYLSVIESRQRQDDGSVVTDPLVCIADEDLLKKTIDEVYKGVQHEIAEKFKAQFVELGGIPIPSNLVVMGTVNMDETTCSFSRKVLDRAMTFELNDVKMGDGLEENPDVAIGSIPGESVKGCFTHAWQVYADAKEVCDKIKDYLVAVNEKLENTPFKFAYRTRDEIMVYCFERMKDGTSLAVALDESTSMKILSRIEGDEQIVDKNWLEDLQLVITNELRKVYVEADESSEICKKKLEQMKNRLAKTGFTSFWA